MKLEDFERLVATGKLPKEEKKKKEKGYRFVKTDRAELIKRQLENKKG